MNEKAINPKAKSTGWKKFFHGMNLTGAAVKLPIFTVLVYLAMNPTLLPYLTALSPIFKPALLVVAMIGWSFSAYELFRENKYLGSRVADLLFKSFVVLMAIASLVTALTLAAASPILSIVVGAGAILYSAGQTFYHSSKILSSNSESSKNHHKKQARTFAIATGIALVLGVAVGLNKVAHIAMTAVATVTAFVIGAATFAGAWKKYSADTKKAKEKEEIQREAAASDAKIYRAAPELTQYNRPRITSQEHLSNVLDNAILKYRKKSKMYGLVKTLNLKTGALQCLKQMVESPKQGKVAFFDRSYQWNSVEELNIKMIELYKELNKLGLFESLNTGKSNQLKFLFDQAIYNVDFSEKNTLKPKAEMQHKSH